MNALPEIGTRVIYRATVNGQDRTCSGVVVSHWPGGDWHEDPETGRRYRTPDHVSVRVDHPLPAWWPYPGTDRFAPPVDEVEPDRNFRTR